MSELPSPTKQQKKTNTPPPKQEKHKTRPCPNSKKSNTPQPKQQKVKHATRPNSKKNKTRTPPPPKQQTQTCTLTWSSLTFLLKITLRSGWMRKGRGFFLLFGRGGGGGGRVLFFAVWAGACVAHAQTAKLKARPVQTGKIEHPKSPNNKKDQTTKKQTLLPHSCCSRWLCA